MPLTETPARSDLTDRECAKLLGGFLGSVMEMTDLPTLRRAVQWWAETDAAWQVLGVIKVQNPELRNSVLEKTRIL